MLNKNINIQFLHWRRSCKAAPTSHRFLHLPEACCLQLGRLLLADTVMVPGLPVQPAILSVSLSLALSLPFVCVCVCDYYASLFR